jgi:hypothetical protein
LRTDRSGAAAWEQNKFDDAKLLLAAALELYQELKVPEAIDVVQNTLNELTSED